jgi:hypothetical protein
MTAEEHLAYIKEHGGEAWMEQIEVVTIIQGMLGETGPWWHDWQVEMELDGSLRGRWYCAKEGCGSKETLGVLPPNTLAHVLLNQRDPECWVADSPGFSPVAIAGELVRLQSEMDGGHAIMEALLKYPEPFKKRAGVAFGRVDELTYGLYWFGIRATPYYRILYCMIAEGKCEDR